MYCAAFIWEPGVYDDEFARLNALIDEVARSLPGFLGADSWQSPDGLRKCSNYYWTDLDTLKVFSKHPTHLEAKRRYFKWYNGYHIVISQVLRSYGDGAFSHATPDRRRPVA